MVSSAAVLSGDDDLLLRESLAELARATHFPVVFGGFVHDGSLTVSHLIGNRHDALRGLEVRNGNGLGGLALAERRPRFTPDYAHARNISHDYDRSVLAEGITMLLAVPVVARDRVSAILYGGLRVAGSFGGVSVEPATRVARAFGNGLDARPNIEPVPVLSPAPGLSAAQQEELRGVYADINLIASRIGDENLRGELAVIQGKLASIAYVGESDSDASVDPGVLTNREVDALTFVALGWTNAAVGRAIGVTETTIKSYMNSAMRKLHATTRYEAVALARRSRLIP